MKRKYKFTASEAKKFTKHNVDLVAIRAAAANQRLSLDDISDIRNLLGDDGELIKGEEIIRRLSR